MNIHIFYKIRTKHHKREQDGTAQNVTNNRNFISVEIKISL